MLAEWVWVQLVMVSVYGWLSKCTATVSSTTGSQFRVRSRVTNIFSFIFILAANKHLTCIHATCTMLIRTQKVDEDVPDMFDGKEEVPPPRIIIIHKGNYGRLNMIGCERANRALIGCDSQ